MHTSSDVALRCSGSTAGALRGSFSTSTPPRGTFGGCFVCFLVFVPGMKAGFERGDFMHHHHNQVPGAALGGDAADGGIPRAAAALDAVRAPTLSSISPCGCCGCCRCACIVSRAVAAPAVAEHAPSRREHPGWLVVCVDAEDASVVRMLDFPLECGALLATCLPTLWGDVDWMDSVELDRSAPAPLEREWSPFGETRRPSRDWPERLAGEVCDRDWPERKHVY